MNKEIRDIRREYSSQSLLEADAASHPVEQFQIWWQHVINAEVVEPNAMTLATASRDGMPSARVVLLKGFDTSGFIFYTNYKSFKALQLEENPKACLVFYWKEVERQVRIIGLVSKVPEDESNDYFNLRPEGSRIGAWASPQSQVIKSREWLDANFQKLLNENEGKQISRPPHWGGYKVTPIIVEFWQGQKSRLHDRLQYTLEEDGTWKLERLAP